MSGSDEYEYFSLDKSRDPESQSQRRTWLHGWKGVWYTGYTLLFVLFLLLTVVWLRPYPSFTPGKAKLFLTKDKTFHISIFSDLHYGENEDDFGIEQDRKSAALMRQVLSQERPDFVVLNGDLVTGENTFAFNSSDYVNSIVAPLVEGGYSWASTYGNHDSKFNVSREALLAKEKKYAGAYTEHSPAGTDGVTNYVLPIFRTNALDKPVALLWFFDSRGGSEYQSLPANQDNIDDSVSNHTARWFSSAQAEMQSKYGTLPSLAFVHIPTPAFLDLQRQSSPSVSGPHYPGLNADIPLAHQGHSNTGAEAIPFMKALLDTPGLHSIYSGHNHGDSWCGRWPDITLPGYGIGGGSSQERPILCFCKHSGYGGYGRWNRGVRQIEMILDEEGGRMSVDTWVRMQSGEVVTAVSLNETYGVDGYDTADGGHRDDK